jgi:hypothetical protein
MEFPCSFPNPTPNHSLRIPPFPESLRERRDVGARIRQDRRQIIGTGPRGFPIYGEFESLKPRKSPGYFWFAPQRISWQTQRKNEKQVVGIVHAAFQQIAPGTDVGVDFSREYEAAKELVPG